MGAGRRQHHAQQEAMRSANEEANRQKAMMEQQQRMMEEQMKAQREAMLAQTKAMREVQAPRVLQSTVGAENTGVRTSRSRRQTTRAMGSGAASLRIPLNIGGGSGGGLSIG